MSQQLTYSIKTNCSDCNFVILINDRPVINFNRGTNIKTEIPINVFLKDGTNIFACKVVPPKDQDILSESAFLKITIIENNENADNPIREVSVFNTPSFKPEDDDPPYTQYSLDGKFTTSILFSSVLSSGFDLKNIEYLHNELFQAYMVLWQAFKSGNIDTVMRLLALKIKESAGLKGTPLLEMEKEMRADYLHYMSDSTLQLWEFTPEKVFLKIYGNNKLACLEVKNGQQPICFINREEHLAIYIPVFFYRNPQNQMLEIIR